jgi:hypothetical protein
MSKSLILRVLLVAGIISLIACSDRSPTTSLLPSGEPVLSTSSPEAPALEALVRGIATSLTDPALRRQVLEDLRDSPFPNHKIHLQSYLGGERGLVLIRAAAAAAGMRPVDLLASVQVLPELEFSMPRPYDQARWTGTEDVILVGTTRPRAEAARKGWLPGYGVGGRQVRVPVSDRVQYPILAITPSATDFGPSPEAKRQRAPRRSRHTISGGDITTATTECGPEAVIECDTSGGGGTKYGGYFMGESLSWAACTNTTGQQDADQDGLVDGCEATLAQQFAPLLSISTSECCGARNSYWAVGKGYNGAHRMRIFYLLAYHYDGGTPDWGLKAHFGDSEFIIIEVEDVSGSGRWMLKRAVLSAHWKQWYGLGDRTGDWGPDDLEYPDGTYAGYPRVYVARDKHANYRTREDCNATYQDGSCHLNQDAARVTVLTERNIGTRKNSSCQFDEIGKVLIDITEPPPGYAAFEYLWTGSDFGGWYNVSSDTAGPYYESLNYYCQ